MLETNKQTKTKKPTRANSSDYYTQNQFKMSVTVLYPTIITLTEIPFIISIKSCNTLGKFIQDVKELYSEDYKTLTKMIKGHEVKKWHIPLLIIIFYDYVNTY